jgi:hypothetical protein
MSCPAHLLPLTLILIPTAVVTAMQLLIPMIPVILLPKSVNQLQLSVHQLMSQPSMPPKT